MLDYILHNLYPPMQLRNAQIRNEGLNPKLAHPFLKLRNEGLNRESKQKVPELKNIQLTLC